ncbi:hypothetical protein [Arsenicicoccus cauae]|uniref:hypothetical protein n=1 Tax=Arsenicicoccus cauae TaxID=2663847 RepID=UPI001E624863|nr:hypothetical protein [Arsenicicoccus cauae]
MSSRPPRDLWAPISVWGHVWRGLLAAVTGTLLFLVSNDPQFSRPLASWVPFVDLVVGVLSLVLLPLHRRSPLLVPVLLQAMTAVSTSSGGSASVALVSVATRRRWPRIALAGVVAMLASLAVSRIYPEIDPMPTALNVATMVLVLAAQIAWGLYLGARRDLFATWQWRAETAEREQAQRISSAREASAPASPARCTMCWPTGSRWCPCTPVPSPTGTTCPASRFARRPRSSRAPRCRP